MLDHHPMLLRKKHLCQLNFAHTYRRDFIRQLVERYALVNFFGFRSAYIRVSTDNLCKQSSIGFNLPLN